MSEKTKNYICLIVTVIALPFLLFFIFEICGKRVLEMFFGAGVIFFDWRSFPLLSIIPILAYMELLFISCFFTHDRHAHPVIVRGLRSITIATAVIFVPSFFIGPAINVALAFSSYHPCASSSIFSGVYYVKDKTKCYGLTGVIPWKKGYGYKDDVKQ